MLSSNPSVTLSMDHALIESATLPPSSALARPHPGDVGCHIRIIREIDELEGLRSYWQRWVVHPNADMDAYISTLRMTPGAAPLVLVAYRDGIPDAMLLGREDIGEVNAKLGYKTIVSPKLRRMVFVYCGLLGNASSENCDNLGATIHGCLRRHEADVAFFNKLKTDCELYRTMTRSVRVLARDLCPQIDTHRSMTLPQHADDLYRSGSAKVRKNLRWQSRRMVKDHPGAVVLRCYQFPPELDKLFRDVEQIASKTYQRGLGVGFVDSPSMRERLYLEARHGWLRAYLLYIQDRPVAFWIGKRYGETFYSDFMGYDADFGRYSPGMYVVTNVIEGMYESQDRPQSIDFGLGDAQYKAVLADIEWQEGSLYVFAPTLKGFALNLLRTSVVAGDQAAKRLLGRGALLQRAKKLWRTRAVTQ